jgi:hypothetical protein
MMYLIFTCLGAATLCFTAGFLALGRLGFVFVFVFASFAFAFRGG